MNNNVNETNNTRMSKQEFYILIKDLTEQEINQVCDWLLSLQQKP